MATTLESPTLPLTFRRPNHDLRFRSDQTGPKRSAPYDMEPGYYPAGHLWLYGNVRLFQGQLAYVSQALGPNHHFPGQLDEIEAKAEALVLDGEVLVCGIHHPAHQRAAVVPLRYGSPRIVVLSGGFHYHLGKDLREEPFRAARLWRYEFDPRTDLAISRRAPDKLPTYAYHNPTVDRLIAKLVQGQWPGLSSPFDSLTTAKLPRG